MVRRHCGKVRKCWLPAFSPFPTMFYKGFFFWVVKSRDCVVKGYDWSELKAFADDITNVTDKIEICFGKSRKHSFLLFSQIEISDSSKLKKFTSDN